MEMHYGQPDVTRNMQFGDKDIISGASGKVWLLETLETSKNSLSDIDKVESSPEHLNSILIKSVPSLRKSGTTDDFHHVSSASLPRPQIRQLGQGQGRSSIHGLL